MTDWLAMGGYAGYVWGSYGVAAAAIVIELLAIARRRRSSLERARAERGITDGR